MIITTGTPFKILEGAAPHFLKRGVREVVQPMRRTLWRSLRSLWLGVCAGLLVLLIMEGAARAVLSMYRHQAGRDDVFEFEQLLGQGAMAGTEWARAYVREFVTIRTTWHPYVYWRVAPRRGRYINVDANGTRRTWNATPAPRPGQSQIFMIGGSGMWGAGARDEFTIPSFVARRLAGLTPDGVWVTNLAQIGWVSTQGVAALLVELHRGHIPDVVIYNDGANDMYSAFQNGVAGLTINESIRAREFRLVNDGDLWPVALRRLALFKFVERASALRRGPQTRRYPGDDPAMTEPLARSAVDVYLTNVEIVEALAARFGFKAFFFFQPTLFTKKHLSDDERREMARPRNARTARYVALGQKHLNERLAAGRHPHVHNLADLFGDERRTMFLDAVHPLETGNDRVAAAMVDVAVRAGALARR
jgi:lysophospholipase L1-like esterase